MTLFQGLTLTSIWTSGSNEGEFCDIEDKYSWCSINSLINQSDVNNTKYWSKMATANSTADRCLELITNDTQIGLHNAYCNDKKPFMCEVRCFKC